MVLLRTNSHVDVLATLFDAARSASLLRGHYGCDISERFGWKAWDNLVLCEMPDLQVATGLWYHTSLAPRGPTRRQARLGYLRTFESMCSGLEVVIDGLSVMSISGSCDNPSSSEMD